MAERKEFDAFLGGPHSLVHEVPILKMVAARASEISAMTYSIENPKQTKLVFQKLPVYMRRRVMSHNVKRLPRRLRQAHLSQLTKSGLPPKCKRLSRKHRRRPTNLLSEYSRRQRNNIWLETHIWHAKRFHMIKKWGYSIASRSNDKCFRANYRAITDHCLLQDISYYTCVEIKGEEDLLKTTLKMHCNPSALSFVAKKYISGLNEGTLMFFRKNGYPRYPIGNIHFLWMPRESSTRTIWIWVHPAFYADFLSEIESSFGFLANGTEKDDTADSVRSSGASSWTNDADCIMTVNKVNRFQLIGPLTLKVLTEVLRLPSFTESDLSLRTNRVIVERQESSSSHEESSNTSMENDDQRTVERLEIDNVSKGTNAFLETPSPQELLDKAWHIEYYKREENMKDFIVQKQWWEELSRSRSLDTLPRNVIGLSVLDPRFYLPERRTKCQVGTTFPQNTCSMSMSAELSRSPIWDTQIRHVASSSCVSTSAINDFRSKCLVPGVLNDRYYKEDIIAKVPVLLVPKRGNIVGSGMDIIMPVAWAMPFLLTLVQRCVRVGALQESRALAFESFDLNTPDVNDPDTPAYTRDALTTKQELVEKYFRRPPDKRVNFTKLGINSPFFCDWKNLMKNWSNDEEFYVLRDRALLLLLQTSIRSRSSNNEIAGHSNWSIGNTQNDFRDFDGCKNCLVRVKVSMMRRGSPKEFAIVCVPTSEDLKRLRDDKKWAGPVERCHDDPNETARVTLRTNHLIKLRRLKRLRAQRRKTLEKLKPSKKSISSIDDVGSAKSASHCKMISEQWEKMSQLYLPESMEVRYSCGREVMGYLTIANYSLSHAKGMGIGYVALPSLIGMIERRSNIVLVRNIQTRQYRLATLDVLDVRTDDART